MQYKINEAIRKMSAILKEVNSNCEFVLSKRQLDLYILHHPDCASLFSDNLNDDRYVKVQNIEEAKKIAEMANKPIIRCSICHV